MGGGEPRARRGGGGAWEGGGGSGGAGLALPQARRVGGSPRAGGGVGELEGRGVGVLAASRRGPRGEVRAVTGHLRAPVPEGAQQPRELARTMHVHKLELHGSKRKQE